MVNLLEKNLKKIKDQKYLFLMLLPGFFIVAIFSYGPLFGWIMAFTNYNLGDSLFAGKWVGLKYFKEFFIDTGDAMHVIKNTICINMLSIFIGLFFACSFAIMLNEIVNRRFKKIVQTASFFPFFISWPIVFIIFYTFFSYTGVMNDFLTKMGFIKDGINFFGEEIFSWPLIVFVNLWKYFGYNTVIFLSSLSSIPSEQYESADIDGANRWQKIVHITIPSLIPTMMVLLLLNLGWIFSSNFEQYFLFTNSANIQTMEVFDMYIYKFGLKLGDYSYATAVSIVKTIASITVLVSANQISKKLNGKSII